ncbi:hypothetical protein VNO78_00433 [Psophocarpus tetragonolobus]|uniref:Uncharacterized protein n=1 Tax=Psophocarpus tetragonolobus TaxID=3891 RepID=A0AAN9XU45_PSOTE
MDNAFVALGNKYHIVIFMPVAVENSFTRNPGRKLGIGKKQKPQTNKRQRKKRFGIFPHRNSKLHASCHNHSFPFSSRVESSRAEPSRAFYGSHFH